MTKQDNEPLLSNRRMCVSSAYQPFPADTDVNKAALTCSNSFTSQQSLCKNDTDCDFNTPSHFYCKTKQSAPLPAVYKPLQMNNEHMQIAWQFHTQTTVGKKNKHFFLGGKQ